MARPFSPGVTGPMAATGGVSPISLIEVLTLSGASFFWSEQRIVANSVLTGAAQAQFLDWVTGVPKFHLFRSTQTDTASFSIQNLSGNTVTRDAATLFDANELIGGLLYFRLWRAAAEASLFDFMGNIESCEIDETEFTVGCEGFGSWSSVRAPFFQIGVSCPLTFGSAACGSLAGTPCSNTFGSCTSLQRFAGVVTEWTTNLLTPPTAQLAQPAPSTAANLQRSF